MKLRSRTRQKTNLKNVIIVGTSFCLLLAAGIFITINVSDVKESKAATNGDFRTVNSGLWDDEKIWEEYNGDEWISSLKAPDNITGSVIISPNTIVVLNKEVSVAGLEVQKSAKLSLKTPALKVQKSGSMSAIVIHGELDAGTCVMSGNASFSLKADASLAIGSAQGIHKKGKQGNVQVEGVRSFNRGATYVYAGNELQFSGTGMPSVVNTLIIDNPSGMKLENSIHVLKNLELQNGALITGDKTLTLGLDITNVGFVNRSNGYINGTLRRWIGLDNMDETLFPMFDGSTYNAFYFKFPKNEFKGGLFTVNYTPRKEVRPDEKSNPDSRIIAVGVAGYYVATGSDGLENLAFKLSSSVAVSKTENKNYWTIRKNETIVSGRTESGIGSLAGINNVSVRPNPFSTNFKLHFNLDQSAETSVEIFSLNGKLIHREKFMGHQDQNVFEFDQTNKMIPGTYIVNVTALSKTESMKIIRK